MFEVILTIEDPDRDRQVDVVAHVEPSHSIADLTAALLHHLDIPPPPPAGGSLARANSKPFDPTALLADTHLLSGDHLIIATPRAAGPARAGVRQDAALHGLRQDAVWGGVRRGAVGPVLVVCSGPDVGLVLSLQRGTTIDIGRDRSCTLALTDPNVERVHLVIAIAASGEITARPGTNAAAPVRLNGEPIEDSQPIGDGDLLVIGATSLAVRSERPPLATDEGEGEGKSGGDVEPGLGQVAFHRTPYYPLPVKPRMFEPLGEIPDAPEPVRFAYLVAVAPLLVGMTMALLYSPRFLVFTLFSPVLAVAGYLEQRRRNRQRYGRGAERFRRRMAERRSEVTAALALERRRRFANAPDLADLADRARTRSPELWVRDRRAPDFLVLRLGLGAAVPQVTVRPDTRGDERLRDELERALDVARTIGDVPVTIDFTRLPVVAVSGNRNDTTQLASSLVLQAACLHSPEDLVIVAGLADNRSMSWLAWLPHLRSPNSPIPSVHLATTQAALNDLLRHLLVVAENRLGTKDRSIGHRWPRLLAVIDRQLAPDPAAVSRLLDAAPLAGISVLWLAASGREVPRQAVAVATCTALANATYQSQLACTDPTIDDQPVQPDRVLGPTAALISRSLAPVRDASEANATSALPRTTSLFDVLDLSITRPAAADGSGVNAAWVEAQWRRSESPPRSESPRQSDSPDGGGLSLRAPIGMTANGPLVIDLVEHGPHGLIGGTSGAGKSELIVSLVAGLAAWNPPTRLNLLFIDYKGGAASECFRELPHTVGYVTNLHGSLAHRALVSLRAELDRRMALLHGRAKDLAELVERIGPDAPPSVVIVVDELATLVKEVPEFVTGLVDIAQRGRSLGIHLVLATQRPSGAVNENILANTNLRICLRMLERAESSNLIGTPDAATIPPTLKGRALARLGPGELIPFQTAWSGAPLPVARPGPAPIRIEPFTPAGACAPHHPVRATPPSRVSSEHEGIPRAHDPASSGAPAPSNQLDALLEAVTAATARLGLPRGRSPWRDELPAQIPLLAIHRQLTDPSRVDPLPAAAGWPVPIGMIDDPEGQDQYPATVDLAAGGGLLVIGTGGSGKTTVLRTVAVSAALGPPSPNGGCAASDHPLTLTIFGLDFASRELTALTALGQCTAVATGDELEAVTRIIALLGAELQRRRAALAAATREGISPPTHGRVLLLIDDYGNLAQTFEGASSSSSSARYPWLEAINRIIIDGSHMGIHTVLTAARRPVVKASIWSAVANRLILRQADRSAYADLGIHRSLTPSNDDLLPGRGYLNGRKLLQVATLADATTTRPAANNELGALRNLAHTLPTTSDPALATHPLPDRIATADLHHINRPKPTRPEVLLGLADGDLATVCLDLSLNNLLIVGDPRTGRTTALTTIGAQLAADGQQIWVAGPTGSALAELADTAAGSALGRPAEVGELFQRLAEAASACRSDTVPVLLIDDFDLLEDRALDGPASGVLAAGVRLVVATSGVRGYSTNPITQELRRARSVLYLCPPGPRDVQELTGCLPSIRPGVVMVPGRGVLVVNRVPTVLQVATPEV